MTHARAFRSARTFTDAIEALERASGTKYEPRLVNAFVALLRRLNGVTDNLDHLLAEGGALFSGGRIFDLTSRRLY